MFLHGLIGAAFVTGWILWETPEPEKQAPAFEVQLQDVVVVDQEPLLEPDIEPPPEPEPEILPAVVVESAPQLEAEVLPEPVEYQAQRPWMPRHLRTRPSSTPEETKPVPEKPQPAKPAVKPPPTPPVSVVLAPAIDQAQCPPPDYPRRAQRMRWHGAVMLLVQVDPQGKPLAVTVRTSSGYEILDNAAIKAVKRWRFHPAKRNGVAEAGQILVPIRFEAPS